MAEDHEMEPLNQSPSCETTANPVYLPEILKLAKENKWKEAIWSIQRNCIHFVQLMNAVDRESGQNILHLASQCGI